MDVTRRTRVYETVDRTVELPMLMLSLLIVPLILVPLVINLSDSAESTVEGAQWIIWGIFATELALKTYLAPRRLPYLRSHWFDVAIVALPFLRPLRLIRSGRILRILVSLRLFAFTTRALHSARMVLDHYGLKYVLVAGLTMILAATVLVGYFERDADGNIENFEDALWWAMVTMTTVGYGDTFPTTPEGRGVAVLLMLSGISLFSYITANIAAFLVQPKTKEAGEPTLSDVMAEIRVLELRIAELQSRISGEAETAREAESVRQ